MKAESIFSDEARTKARPRSDAFDDVVGEEWLETLRFTARKDDAGLFVLDIMEDAVGFSIL
jgi:hypothetical protein